VFRRKLLVIVIVILLISFIESCSKKTTEPNSNIVKTPVFSPSGGTYEIGQSITITCPTGGVEIRYTIDGSEPSSESTLFITPLIIPTIFPSNTNTGTVKAKAYKEGFEPSPTKTATYSVTYANTVATPVISPQAGNIVIGSQVSIECSTPGAQIRYTLNGDGPTINSTIFTESFEILQSGQVTVKAKAYRDTWNPSLIVSANYNVTIPTPEMILVPGGTFTMGNTLGGGDSEELPTHSVTLSAFYIGKYEVTQSEWQATMEFNPAHDDGVGESYPVYYVSWYDILKYCNLRSMAEGLTPVYAISSSTNPADWGSVPTASNATWNAAICNWSANGYRLPTEAEWEYAARSGTTTPDYLYSGSDDINAVAWYSGNDTPFGTKPVGGKAANGLGIYDMSGNVYEWCWDWYSYSYYSSSPSSNPTGPGSGSNRLLRGGYWSDSADDCRVSSRDYLGSFPYYSISIFGFRLCRAN